MQGSSRQDQAVLVAIVAAALNLRVAVVAVGPVLGEIRTDLGMSGAVAGLLTAVPFLCMGMFALLGPALLSRLGALATIGWCLGGLGVATALRAVMPTELLLLLLTVPIGICIALAGVALPSVVRERFRARAGRITGLYVAAMSLGAALAALAIVPVSEVVGGWRQAFALTALPCAAAIPVWLRARPQLVHVRTDRWRIDRLPTAQHLTLGAIFATASMTFTGTVTWVSPLYVDQGWSAELAAAVTAAIMAITVVASLSIPGLSDRSGRRRWTAASAALVGAGLLGFAVAPVPLAPVWLVAFALGNGALFPLVLTLPVDVGADRRGVALASAWALAIGFTCGSTAPVLFGALLDASGGYALPMAVLSLVAFAGALLALTSRRHLARPRPASR